MKLSDSRFYLLSNLATSLVKLNRLQLGLLLLVGLLLTGCKLPLNKRKIVVLGDDHAAAKNGWVYYFQRLRSGGPMLNAAVAGATTAFPSPSQPALNTLDQLVPYLRKGFAEMGAIDEVIIQLGTNDCKAQYQAGDVERSVKFRELIGGIKSFFAERGQPAPRIVILSPPVFADEVAISDFENSKQCLRELVTDTKQFAQKEGICFVDISENKQLLNHLNPDGVHFSSRGLELMAELLKKGCY